MAEDLINIPLHAIVEPRRCDGSRDSKKLGTSLLLSTSHRVVGFCGNDGAYVIRIDPAYEAPRRIPYDDLAIEIEKGLLSVAPERAVAGVPTTESDIPEHAKADYKLKKAIIDEVVQEKEMSHDWMSRPRLRTLVQLCAKALDLDRLLVQRTIYRWLASGRSLLNLVSRRGKPRSGVRRRAQRGKKKGRKFSEKTTARVVKKYSLPKTPENLAKLHQGIAEFYDPSRKNLSDAYDLTNGKYFSKKVKGVLVTDPQLFTKRQFRDEVVVVNQGQKLRLKNVGDRQFGRENRGVAGTERDGVPGPTFVYQSDATFPEIDVVSETDLTTVLGIATVYLTIDVWSGVVVGDLVTHQNASLNTARTAIFYAFSDKYSNYRRAGVHLAPGSYDCHHACHRLDSDRGEWTSDEADQFVRGLGLRLVNVLPERPDLKGTVEHFNRLLELEGLSSAPGYRRGRKWKGRIAMTLSTLRRAVKRVIRKLNLRPAIEIPLEVKLGKKQSFTRMDHFNWGIKNIRGIARSWSAKELYLKLLPREMATISKNGIFSKGHWFSSKGLANSGMNAVGGRNASRSIEIMYDSDDFSRVWIENLTGGDPIELICKDQRVVERRASVEDAKLILERDSLSAKATLVETQDERSQLALENHEDFEAVKRSAATMARRKKQRKPSPTDRREAKRKAQQHERRASAAEKQEHAALSPPKPIEEIQQKRSALHAAVDARRRQLAKRLAAAN